MSARPEEEDPGDPEITHPELPSPERLRMAAVALTNREWCEFMEFTVFEADTKVRDGHADNARLIQAYLKGNGR
jgi:hypothetical protein